MVSSSRLFCSALKASERAANFSLFSTAISWLILSIRACLKAISRSLAATVLINERTTSRSCVGSNVSMCSWAITGGDRARTSSRCTSAYSAIALQHGDDPGLANALPGQAKHEGIELRMGQAQRPAAVPGPNEPAAIEASGRKPHADAVVHEHLHAVGAAVGKQVRVVRAGRTEHVDDTREGGLGAGPHIQRLNGQPHGIQADHRSSSRIQAPKSAAADTGQVIVIVVVPRRSWIWMPRSCVGGTLAGSDTGTNSPAAAGSAASPWRASCRHRCTTLALMPCDIATLATDAPGASHSAITCACNCAL